MNFLSRRDFLKLARAFSINIPLYNLLNKVVSFDQTPQTSADSQKSNIIVLLFDTLSAPHMSLYGCQRKTTPYIDAFANKSTIFHKHYSAGNYTVSSTASLLTGTYPWTHRALHMQSIPLDYYKNANVFGEAFHDGYRNIAYTHNLLAFYILNHFKANIQQLTPVEELTLNNPAPLAQFFNNDFSIRNLATRRWQRYHKPVGNSFFIYPFVGRLMEVSSYRIQSKYANTYPIGLGEINDGHIYKLEDAIDWIPQQVALSQQPFLGYFHLAPPHGPYRPRLDYYNLFANKPLLSPDKPAHFFSGNVSPEKLSSLQQRYDEYIAFVDSEFNRLLSLLEQKGILDTSYIIVTSDHGELFERGIHGHITPTMFEPLIHIPLIVHSPNQTRRKDVHVPTSLVDIAPTVMNLINPNKELPGWFEGQVLPELGGVEDATRLVFSMDGKENYKLKPLTKATFSAIRWPYKLIHYSGYAGYNNIDELFNLDNDPEELNNLATTHASVVADLKDALRKNQIAAEKKCLGYSITNY